MRFYSPWLKKDLCHLCKSLGIPVQKKPASVYSNLTFLEMLIDPLLWMFLFGPESVQCDRPLVDGSHAHFGWRYPRSTIWNRYPNWSHLFHLSQWRSKTTKFPPVEPEVQERKNWQTVVDWGPSCGKTRRRILGVGYLIWLVLVWCSGIFSMISKDDPADFFWKDEPHLRTLLGWVETLPARLPK